MSATDLAATESRWGTSHGRTNRQTEKRISSRASPLAIGHEAAPCGPLRWCGDGAGQRAIPASHPVCCTALCVPALTSSFACRPFPLYKDLIRPTKSPPQQLLLSRARQPTVDLTRTDTGAFWFPPRFHPTPCVGANGDVRLVCVPSRTRPRCGGAAVGRVFAVLDVLREHRWTQSLVHRHLFIYGPEVRSKQATPLRLFHNHWPL